MPLPLPTTAIRQRSLTRHCRLGRATELVFILATGVMLTLGEQAMAQTWDGETNANWSTVTNWNPNGLPGAGGTVTISGAGAGNQPIVDTNQTVTQTNVTAGSLTVAATLTSPVTISGTGTVTINAGGSITGAVENGGTGTLSNSGTITGALTVSDGVNTNSGVVTGNTTVSGGELTLGTGSNLANGGTVTVSGTGTLNVDANDTVAVVTQTGGAIDSSNGSTLTTGTFTQSGGEIAAGGTVSATTTADLLGGTIDGTLITANPAGVQTGTTLLSGTINGSVSVASQLNLDGGSVTGSINLGSGTLNATGDSTVAGTAMNVVGNTTGTISADAGQTLTIQSSINLGATTTTTFGSATETGTVVIESTAASLGVGSNTVIAGGTVRMGSDLQLFTNSGGFLAGQTLTIDAAGTLDTNGRGNARVANLTGAGTITNGGATQTELRFESDGASEFSGVIEDGTGDFSVVKVQAGTLTLSGANTFTGTTTVQAGVLNVTGSIASTEVNVTGGSLSVDGAAVDDDAAVSLTGTGNLTLTGSETIGSLAGVAGTTVTLGANTLTTGGNDDSTTMAGVIGGTTGGITKEGSGTFILSGANTYGGNTAINEGVVRVNTGGTLGANTGTVSVASDAALELGGSVTVSNPMSIAGDGTGAGAIVSAAGNNSVNGTITLTADAGLGAAAGAVLNVGGTITGAGNDLTTAGAGIKIVTGNITTGSGGVTNTAGDLLLRGINTYTGDTVVDGGQIAVGNGSAISDGGAVIVNAGTFVVETTETVGSIAGAGAVEILAGQTLTTGGNGTTTTLSGVVSGGGALTKEGTGTFTLSGSNTYAGATTVNGGTLSITNGSALGTTAGGTTVAAGAALAMSGGISTGEAITLNGTGVSNGGALVNASGNNLVSSQITLGSGTRINSDAGQLSLTGGVSGTNHNLTVGGAGNIFVASDITTGSGTLTKDGSGAVALGGVNTFTGATSVNAGFLVLQGAANTGLSDTAQTSVAVGAVLQLNVSETVGSLSGAGSTNLNGPGVTLTTGGDGSTTTFSGVIIGNGALTKTGAGTLTLSGANSYAGVTTVAAGTLDVTGSIASAVVDVTGGSVRVDGAALSDTAAVTLSGTGNMTLTGSETIGSLAGGATTTVTLGANTLTTGDAGDDVFAGVMSGAGGGLTKTGAGTLELSGANTNTGPTTVNGGTLNVTGSIASAVVTLNAGGALQVDGASLVDTAAVTLNGIGSMILSGSETIGSLAGAGGTVQLDAALTTGGNGVSTSYGGVFSGASALNKVGAGTLTLTGNSTAQTGAINVHAGTLAYTGSGATASTDIETVAGATLKSDGGAFGTGLVITNAGTTTLTGSESISTITGTGGVTLTGGSTTLTLNGTGTVEGVISGNGNLAVAAGTTTLSGTNTYSGATVVNGGTLAVTGSITSHATVNNTGTMTNEGTVADVIVNNGGEFTNETGGVAGAVTNNAGGTFTNETGATAASVASAGTGSNAGTITTTLGVTGGTFTNTGIVSGDTSVSNGTLNVDGGTFNGATTNNGNLAINSGNFGGGLTNNADATALGAMTGNVTNAGAGTFTLTGDLTAGGGSFANAAALNIGVNDYTGAGAVTNTGTTTISSGGSLQAASIGNTGGGVIRLTGATLGGAITNDATITAAGSNTVTGSLAGSGTMDLTATAGDHQVIFAGGAGSVASHRFALNYAADGTGDVLVSGGGNAFGAGSQVFDISIAGNFALGTEAVLVSGQTAIANTLELSGATVGGVVVYSVIDSGDDTVLVAETNPGIGGIVSGMALTQALIANVVNRPSSPFSGELVSEQGCSNGGYFHTGVGKSSANGTSFNGTSTASHTLSARFGGAQGGFEISCNDGRFFNGWDGAIGALVGYNMGGSNQPIMLDLGGGTPTLTSTTNTDFYQKYLGFYVVGSLDRLTFDARVRFEDTKYTLNETVEPGFAGLGLNDTTFNARGMNFNGRVSYQLDLGDDGVSFVPAVGVSISRTGGASLTFTDGTGAVTGLLSLDAYTSTVGILGGTISKTTVNEAGDARSTPFVSANYYHEFGGDLTSTFTATQGGQSQINASSIGGFTEASVGWNYVKILEPGPGGSRQLNTNVRADARFGGNVSDSYSLNALVRLSF